MSVYEQRPSSHEMVMFWLEIGGHKAVETKLEGMYNLYGPHGGYSVGNFALLSVIANDIWKAYNEL